MAQTFESLDGQDLDTTIRNADVLEAGGAPARPLGLAFLALAGVTYVLIVLGALVRAHGAGLACPDWPLCFGELVPRFDFKVAFEWGHRALAGSVGLIFAALAILTLRSAALRRRVAWGIGVAAVLLAAQIVLGGLTVLELLASWTVTSHLVTGNAFALALVLLGRRLLELDSGARPSHQPAAALPRMVAFAAGALLLAQLIVGGLVSSNYAGLACPDWPACIDGEVFPTWAGIRGIHVLHRTIGYAFVLVMLAAAGLARHHVESRGWLLTAAGLALLQVAVGIANVLLRVPVEVTALHSAIAAALVCTLGIGLREIGRRPARLD